jgi:hypothetical protein
MEGGERLDESSFLTFESLLFFRGETNNSDKGKPFGAGPVDARIILLLPRDPFVCESEARRGLIEDPRDGQVQVQHDNKENLSVTLYRRVYTAESTPVLESYAPGG